MKTAETVRALLAPLCPGLAERALPEADSGAAFAGRRLRLELADQGELPELRRPTGVDPSGQTRHEEAYRLTVDGRGITCAARSPRGLLRGAASAAQLLGTGGDLVHGSFDDAPFFAWRGLMLDPARSFIPTSELFRLVDLAALYKLNVLHLHLTDNEAWRIEVPGRARLVESAADGWYSEDDYRELQRYAAERWVTVVPEVDMPGHCAAALRAYPGLGTLQLPSSLPAAVAAALPAPLDPRDGRSRRFIEEVYGAIAAATQGPYVHVGADEVFGIAPGPFAEAVDSARGAVRGAGRRPLAWQEAARAGSGPEDVSQFWVDTRMADLPTDPEDYAARPEFAAAGLTLELVRRMHAHFEPADEDVRRAVEGGGSVLLSPQSHLYLDRAYDPAEVREDERARLRDLAFPQYRPRSLREAAAWSPFDHGVPQGSIAGVEATLFGSTLGSVEDLSLMLLPRLPAIAEAAWSGGPGGWPDYRARLAAHSALWRKLGLPYAAVLGVDWS